jgi:hypothetical protein
MSDEALMAHQWIYVVIPVEERMRPYLCAYCKVCRNYYTEPLPFLNNKGLESKSSLPKWGCALPPDGVVP